MTATVARPPAPAASGLSDRSRRILTTLVREYIERGEPVSSLWLARHGGFGLSSATVRNTLGELERLGYVKQPHPSAGRVPTDLGYRCYVDSLLAARRTGGAARRAPQFARAATVTDLLTDASHELSRVAHNLAFALAPASEAVTLQHIDFVPLGGTRVLVVVIGPGGHLAHKAVDLQEVVPPEALVEAANYLNAEFAGWPLWKIRAEIAARLAEERVLYDTLLKRALRLAHQSLAGVGAPPTLVVQGASLLLEEASQGADRVPLETLRTLFALIEEKDRLIRLLAEYVDGPGLTIVIGTEHPAPDLRDFSLVASPYADGTRRGTVGVIGPRRMRYSRAIAAVDRVSRAVSRVLEATTSAFDAHDARPPGHLTA